MIIVNTTFVVYQSIAEEICHWIKNTYLASASKYCVKPEMPLLAKVLSYTDLDTSTYAIHIYFENIEKARKWNEGVGASLRKLLADRWGERALTFDTYLEVIE